MKEFPRAKKLFFFSALLLLFLVVALWLRYLSYPGEPVYFGRTLDYWIEAASSENLDKRRQGQLILLQLLEDQNALVRAAVVAGLSRTSLDDEAIVLAIEKRIVDTDPEVRRLVVCSLASARPVKAETIAHLCQSLRDPNWVVRRSAVFALWRVSSENAQAIEPLSDALTDDNQEVSSLATSLLIQTGPGAKGLIPKLIALLEDPKAESRAAVVLANIGPDAQTALPALKKRAETKDPVRRKFLDNIIKQIEEIINSSRKGDDAF
jgi:HEAT repeat protein